MTAKGTAYDCVSRIFAPKIDVAEDSVTGNTHCMITPYWCKKLGKNQLRCYQTSERSGALYTGISGNRVTIAEKALLFSIGEILKK
ncbi:MAG: PhzF family phenazine biosynthesis protein [Sharpea porci]